MVLKKINYNNFKILNTGVLNFNSNLNFIFGNNGFGKTSFLEAIHYTLTAHSFFKTLDTDLVHYNADFFQLETQIEKNNGSYKTYVYYNKTLKQKKYLIDSKKVPTYNTLLNYFPLVYFTPFDSDILRESPLERRRFFDRTISYRDQQYFEHIKQYHKLIKEKNLLLKRQNLDMLSTWNEQIIEIGAQIIEKRLLHISLLNKIIENHDFTFDGLKDSLEIKYKGALSKEALSHAINNNKAKEIQRRVSLYGPHREDYLFYAKNEQRFIKNQLSLGQTKMVAFYLKVMELTLLNETLEEKPIFLVDDIFSELDSANKEKVIEIIKKLPNQIFIATTKENINFYKKDLNAILIEKPGEIKINL